MENQFNTSLWGDEGFSAILSMKADIPTIIKIIITDTSPPLYNITEHIAFRLFGTEEVVIRGLSFFYYVLAVFFVYLLATHVWNKRTGLIAAALTFFNPFFFIYAFEGRMYSIMALGVAASMYFFVTRKWKRYVVATLWALYSHHFAIFAVMLQGGWFVWEFLLARPLTPKRSDGGRGKLASDRLKGFIVTGILYLPWVYPLYLQTKMVGGGFWLGTPNTRDLFNMITEYLANGIKSPLGQPAFYLVVSGLLIRRWGTKVKSSSFMAVWFLGPLLLAWGVSQYFQSIFFNRYLLYAIPGGMILLASNRRRVASAVVIGLILGMFITIDYNYFFNPIKRPFKELAEYVLETKRGDDFLINWNSGSHHLWETKYYGIPAPIYIPDGGELPFFVGTALMEEADIIHKIPGNPFRVGAVTSGSVDDVHVAGYTEDERLELRDINFVWLKRVGY